MSALTKSPIKDKPLRHPGQSLEEARRKLVEDRLEIPLLLAVVFILFAAMEWWRYFWEMPPNPLIFSIFAVFFVGFAGWRLWKTRARIDEIKQGIEGEKAVGQFLEGLRGSGYHVFHDLIGDGFNVDHVLIGPAGVFTIETKTWSKPVRGEAKILFDGEQLSIHGREPERNPVIQARAQSSWLKALLTESTGRNFDVFPVVAFPGWYIDQSNDCLQNIWVLEPKALVKFLAKAPQKLKPDEVSLASFHLSRFIRSGEPRRNNK